MSIKVLFFEFASKYVLALQGQKGTYCTLNLVSIHFPRMVNWSHENSNNHIAIRGV